MHIKNVRRYYLLGTVAVGVIFLYIATVYIEYNNGIGRLHQLLRIDNIDMTNSFLKNTYLYEILTGKFDELSELWEQRKRTCKPTISSEEQGQMFLLGEPVKSFLQDSISQKNSQYSSNISLKRIHTLIKIFEDFEKLENCRSKAQREWLLRLSSSDCQSRRPRDRKSRSFYHAQVYHNQRGWKTLHLFSTGIAVQGHQRPDDLGKCDLLVAQVLPSLYNSTFRTQLAETNAIIALGFSANCLPQMSQEVDWISTGSWKSDKIPAPCDHLRHLDLLRITSMLAEQTNISLSDSAGTIDGIIWNNDLGTGWHYTEAHPGMRSLMAKFFKEVFRMEISNVIKSPQRKEWMFYGLSLPCCSHFALRRSAFNTLAKFHVLSLVYMIIHHGEPYSCPWPLGTNVGERCWSFLNERLTAVFLRILTNHVDITGIKQCDVYNTTFGPHKAIDEFRATLHNLDSLFTIEGINRVYNHMKCELFSVII